MKTTTILGTIDVARALEMTPQNLANMMRNNPNYPKPSYQTPGGARDYWSQARLTEWRRWRKGIPQRKPAIKV